MNSTKQKIKEKRPKLLHCRIINYDVTSHKRRKFPLPLIIEEEEEVEEKEVVEEEIEEEEDFYKNMQNCRKYVL